MKKDSKEESYFIDYLNELKSLKIVKKIERMDTFSLIKPIKKNIHLFDNDNLVLKPFDLLREHDYTGDFKITFNNSIEGFIENENSLTNAIKKKKNNIFVCTDNVAYIETKANYIQPNELRCFKINQKLMYQIHGIYVNLIKIPEIFEYSFTPDSYLYTEKKKQLRKLKYQTKTCKQFINEITKGN